MKFKVTLTVSTKKTGLDLLDAIERIGFDPEDFNGKFPAKSLTIEVSRDFVKAHAELFNGGTDARIAMDLDQTNPDEWEDWGSAGPMLSAEIINESFLTSRI